MIHGAVGHPKTNYILVAAKFANENLKVVPVNLKSKEAKQLSPLGKFPVTSVDQLNIVDPTAAVRYLHNDSEFFRGTPEDIVLIENWLDFATTELDPAFAAWIDPILG
jgi:glutathione S-transferase